jgi:hypothetical protein
VTITVREKAVVPRIRSELFPGDGPDLVMPLREVLETGSIRAELARAREATSRGDRSAESEKNGQKKNPHTAAVASRLRTHTRSHPTPGAEESRHAGGVKL